MREKLYKGHFSVLEFKLWNQCSLVRHQYITFIIIFANHHTTVCVILWVCVSTATTATAISN